MLGANAGPGQRLFMVALPRQPLSGVSAEVLLPLLRKLERMGAGRRSGGPTPLRAQAVEFQAAVGGEARSRRDRAGAARAPFRQPASRDVADHRDRETDAPRV